MRDQIKVLIAETEKWHAVHKAKFDSYLPGTGKRHVGGIEAAACTIRLKALNECLVIVDLQPAANKD